MGFVGPLCDSAIRVIQANQARLPKEVEHLIASVHTLSRVSDCIKRQEEGKSHGGLLELSTLVEQAAKARELTPKLLELRKADKDINAADAARKTALNNCLKKIDTIPKVISDFGKKYFKVEASFATWQFDECGFMFKPSDVEGNRLAKQIEQFHTQAVVWTTMLDKCSHITCIPADDCDRMKGAVVALRQYEPALLAHSRTLASMMVATTISQSESGDCSKELHEVTKYIRKTCIDDKTLPPKVVEKLGVHLKTGVATADPAKASVALAGSTDAAQTLAPKKLKKTVKK
jgi:hypothetical protein